MSTPNPDSPAFGWLPASPRDRYAEGWDRVFGSERAVRVYSETESDRFAQLQDILDPDVACPGCEKRGPWRRCPWQPRDGHRWWERALDAKLIATIVVCPAWPACIRCLEHDDCRETAGLPVDEPQGLALAPEVGITCAERSGLRRRKGRPVYVKPLRGAARRRAAMEAVA